MVTVAGRPYSRLDLLRRVGRLDQTAGVRLVALGDGAARGVRVLEFRSGGGLCFDVLVDRAFDLGRCEYQGHSVAWQSAAGVSGPWFAEPMGLGWFRSWGGGLLTTCGLDHTLLGGVDEADQFHQLVRPSEEYGLHGRVGFLPAQLIGYGETWSGDDCVLRAEAVVRQSAVFAETLDLHRRIEVDLGGVTIRIRDEVTNAGWNPTTHMLLYHTNVGFPVLDDGSELLLAAASDGTPADRYPDHEHYRTMTGPIPGYPEQCWEHDLAAADGIVTSAVVNRRLGLGVYQRHHKRQLPFHTVWRMLGEGTYAVALEPSTNRDAGRFDARSRGELQWLRPGETRRYDLEVGVLPGAAAIDACAAEIAAATAGATAPSSSR